MITPVSMDELHQLSERGVAVYAARYARRMLPPDEVNLEFKAILYDVGNITDSETLSKIADATKAGKSDLKILRPMLRQRGYEFVDPSELGPLGALWPDGRPT